MDTPHTLKTSQRSPHRFKGRAVRSEIISTCAPKETDTTVYSGITSNQFKALQQFLEQCKDKAGGRKWK